MPETIGAAIASSFVEAGWIAQSSEAAFAAYAAFAVQATVVVTSYAYSQQAARAQKRAIEAMLSRDAQLTTVRATAAVRPLVVGRTRAGGPTIAFAGVSGAQNQYLHLVIPLAAHRIDAIEDVYFDNESLGALDNSASCSGGGGFVTTGKFARATSQDETAVVTWPASGGLVNCPAGTSQVLAAALGDSTINMYDGDGQRIGALLEGTHYAVEDGTPMRVRALTSEYAGQNVILSIRRVFTRPLVRVKKYLGLDEGERDLDLEAECPGRWTQYHLGRGVPRVHIRLEHDRDVFGPIGMPNVTCVMRGALAYNWANGTTSWTRNAARLQAWFIMRPEGFNAGVSDFDSTLALAAQNASAENVPILSNPGQNQPRYQLDGVIYPDGDPLQILSELLTASVGEVVNVGGKWDLHAGIWEAPTFTITDDMIAGPMEYSRSRSLMKKFNSIRGKFSNPAILWNEDDVPPYASATFISQDGGDKLWTDARLPFTTDVETAQRVHRLLLYKDRNPGQWTVQSNMRAYPVRAGTNVYVKATAYGWEGLNGGLGKLMHVERREFRFDGTIMFVMRETAPQIFDWNYAEATLPDPTPDTAWPDWTYVEPVRNLAFSSGTNTYTVEPDGTVVPFVELSFTPPATARNSGAIIVVRWRKATELTYREEKLSITDTKVRLRGVSARDVILVVVTVELPSGVRSIEVPGKHTASIFLPRQGAPAAAGAGGGNLVVGADYAFGTEDFLVSANSCPDPVGFVKPTLAAQLMPGIPSNAVLFQAGASLLGFPFKYGAEDFPVEEGKRYAGWEFVIPVHCSAFAGIGWLREDKSVIDVTYGNSVASVAEGTEAPLDFGAYQRVGVKAYAPAGAKFARLAIYKTGTQTGASSGVYCMQPMFCEIDPDEADWPLWAPGIPGTVNNAQLGDNAVAAQNIQASAVGTTAIANEAVQKPMKSSLATSGSVPEISTGSSYRSITTLVAQLTYTADHATWIDVTAPITGVCGSRWQTLNATLSTSVPGAPAKNVDHQFRPGLEIPRVVAARPPGAQSAPGSQTLTASIRLDAGETVTLYLFVESVGFVSDYTGSAPVAGSYTNAYISALAKFK